ncbi:MAG: pilus assembly protein PilM [Nitrospirota bacterium]|nr:pilus assembly protein PilM [Nitrospirota bacterium]
MIFFSSTAPSVGIEVTATSLRGVRLAAKGRQRVVAARAFVDLPSGLVTGTFSRPNVADGALFREHLARLCTNLGAGQDRVALALPDAAARVHLMAFETLPRKESELRDIIVWRLKRDNLLPFEPEEARVVYQIMGGEKAKGEIPVLASIMRRDVLEQYVSLCQEASLEPMTVDIASFQGANFFHDEMRRHVPGSETRALVQCEEKRASLMVFDGDILVFFRSKETGAGTEGAADAVMATLQSSLHYYNEQRKNEKPIAAYCIAGHEKRMDWCGWLRNEPGVRLISLDAEKCVEREAGVSEDRSGEYCAATGAALGNRG